MGLLRSGRFIYRLPSFASAMSTSMPRTPRRARLAKFIPADRSFAVQSNLPCHQTNLITRDLCISPLSTKQSPADPISGYKLDEVTWPSRSPEIHPCSPPFFLLDERTHQFPLWNHENLPGVAHGGPKKKPRDGRASKQAGGRAGEGGRTKEGRKESEEVIDTGDEDESEREIPRN